MNINLMLQNTVIATFTDADVITGGQQQARESTDTTGSYTNGGAAQPAGDGGGGGGLFSPFMIVIWIGMFAAMYFLLFRPQRKREKQAKEMQESLRVGDNILTSGGIYGKIASIGADAFLVEFGENRGVRVWIRKSDVLGVKSPTTTPPPADKIEDKAEDKKDVK